MKETKSKVKTSFFKKIFIKICRIFGFEIIDQSTFEVSTLSKSLNESLSVPGKKSIVVPLGEIKITRKIKSLTIIFRSCTNELIMDQNKKRLFEKDKNEYTFRSLNSLLKSVKTAKKMFDQIDFEIIITDTNSKKADLSIMKSIISEHNIKYRLIEIQLENFKDNSIGTW